MQAAFLRGILYLGKYSKQEKRIEAIWKEAGKWMKLSFRLCRQSRSE